MPVKKKDTLADVRSSASAAASISIEATKSDPFSTDPVLRYLLGSAIGGRCGLCPIWRVKPTIYRGIEYFAEIDGDTLTVTKGGDNFVRANADEAIRKAREAFGQAQRMYEDVKSQVSATEEARDRAQAEFERATVQQKRQAERVLESWNLTLDEVRPRLDVAKERMDAAEAKLEATRPAEPITPQVFSISLTEFDK